MNQNSTEMSTNVTLDMHIPSSLEEDILNYLREQERELQQHEGDKIVIPPEISYTYSYPSEKSVSRTSSYIKTILNDVLIAIERRARFKHEYMKKLHEHNQFELFDLSKIIPNFYIDDVIADQLCFRETIVIGHLQEQLKNAPPTPVGGICLNIQKAKGSHPLDRKIPSFTETPREDTETTTEDIQEIKEVAHEFSEELTGSSAADLDEYKKMLQHEMRKERCKFLVHLSSQFDCEQRNGGSRITSWVDRNLHTLEENRREYLVDSNGSVDEKTLYVALQIKRYYLKMTNKKEEVVERKFYKLDKTKYFVSEGANFLLMRYLAIVNYMGQFELSTLYINGDMCRNIYICTGLETGIINDKNLKICKIQRIIMEECGNIHRCVTVLTAGGRIVKQDWENIDYVLYVNPLSEITDEKPSAYEKISLAKRWEDDMQLFSQYLDAKNTYSMKTKSYVKDHPELKNLISDYVKKILHMKPTNVMEFSLRYFTQCFPDVSGLARSEYWNESEPPLY